MAGILKLNGADGRGIGINNVGSAYPTVIESLKIAGDANVKLPSDDDIPLAGTIGLFYKKKSILSFAAL